MVIFKKIKTIVDFERHIESTYQMSIDSEHAKKLGMLEEKTCERNNDENSFKYQREVNERINEQQKKRIGEMKPSGVFVNHRMFHVNDKTEQEDWNMVC